MKKHNKWKKLEGEIIPEENFTKEFVKIIQKHKPEKSSYEILKVISEIKSRQKPKMDEKDEIDTMIMEETKRICIKNNAMTFGIWKKDSKEKIDSMNQLNDIPKIESNFTNYFDKNSNYNYQKNKKNSIINNHMRITNMNDSFLSKINKSNFSSGKEEKCSLCI